MVSSECGLRRRDANGSNAPLSHSFLEQLSKIEFHVLSACLFIQENRINEYNIRSDGNVIINFREHRARCLVINQSKYFVTEHVSEIASNIASHYFYPGHRIDSRNVILVQYFIVWGSFFSKNGAVKDCQSLLSKTEYKQKYIDTQKLSKNL